MAKQTYNVYEVSLKSFSLCEQRMRLGYLVVSYSLALGILARIYSLSKGMLLISSRLVLHLKKKLISHLSSSEIEKELSSFTITTLKPIGFEGKDLSILSKQEDVYENSNEVEDLGVVVQRDEILSESSSKHVTNIDQENNKLTEVLIKNYGKDIAFPASPIKNVNNLKSFRIAYRDVLLNCNKSQRTKAKLIFTQSLQKAKYWKVNGRNDEVKKEIKLALARMALLLKANVAETAARFEGYQSISDDENVTNTLAMDLDQKEHVVDPKINFSNKLSSKIWNGKKALFNVMKKKESVKDMLSTWDQMLSGERDDLSELIPREVSPKDKLKIKNFLLRISKITSIKKPKTQVKKVAKKVVALIEKVIGR